MSTSPWKWTVVVLFIPKRKNKEFHTFPNGFSPKMNLMTPVEFELVSTMLQSDTLATTPQDLLHQKLCAKIFIDCCLFLFIYRQYDIVAVLT